MSCAVRMLQHEIMVPKPSSLNSAEETRLEAFDVDSGLNCYDDTRLKQELRIAAEHCQILAEKLCRNDLSPARKARMSTSIDRCSSSSDGDCCQENRLKMKAIVAENIRLRQVLKDVTEINKRWQKYNTQQQDYVHRLQETIEILQSGDDVPTPSNLKHVPFRQDEDRAKLTLVEHSQSLASLKKSYEKAVKENCQLQKLVQELRSALASKEQENMSEDKLQDSMLRHAQEQAEVFLLQARAHREDWEAEKSEKEEIKRKLARAETDLKELTSKCQAFESQLQRIQAATFATLEVPKMMTNNLDPWDIPGRPITSPADWSSKPQQHEEQKRTFHIEPQLRVLSRGHVKRHPEEGSKSTPVDYDIQLDAMGPPCAIRTKESPNSYPQRTQPTSEHHTYQILSHKPRSLDVTEDSSKDAVCCPSCGRQFSSSEHLRFLDHFEECQKRSERLTSECLVSLN